MAEIGSLIINLGLETGRLDRDSRKAARSLNRFDKKGSRSLNHLKGRVTGLGKSLGSLTGIMGVLSVAGLGVMVKSILDGADAIQKMSDRIGISTEALSQYQHVAKLSGVEFNTLTKGFQNMTDKISDAAMGIGEAAVSLKQLNLNAQELNQLTPDEQFEAIADAMQGIVNNGDRVRIAMDLFGARGLALLQTMNDGAAGIRAMREEADDLGLTLSRDQVAAAALANDEMTRLTGAFKGLTQEIILGLAPQLSGIISTFATNLPESIKLAKSWIDRFWLALGAPDMASDQARLTDLSKQLQSQTQSLVNLHNKLKKLVEDGASKNITDYLQRIIDDRRTKINHLFDLIDMVEARMGMVKTPLIIPVTPKASSDTTGSGLDDAAQKRMQSKLDNLTLSLMTEEERLQESLNRRQDIVADSFENGLVGEEARNALMLQLKKDHESKLTGLTKKGADERNRYYKFIHAKTVKETLDGLQELTSGVTKNSKILFKINQGAAIVDATMNAHVAFSKALAQGGLWGYAKAALILKVGLENVKIIAGQSFGGGGGTPSTSTAITGGPVDSVPTTEGGSTGTASATSGPIEIHITVDGTGKLDRDQAEEIAESLRDLIRDGGDPIAA